MSTADVFSVMLAAFFGFLVAWILAHPGTVPMPRATRVTPTASPCPSPDAYGRAINLIDQQLQLFWLVYGGMLLAETVLLGGIMSISKDGPAPLVLIGGLLGFFLAVPWWTSFQYNHAMWRLRIEQARAMEPCCGTFFTEGQALIEGAEVRGITMRLSLSIRPRDAVASLIVGFGTAFVAMIAFSVWRIFQ